MDETNITLIRMDLDLNLNEKMYLKKNCKFDISICL